MQKMLVAILIYVFVPSFLFCQSIYLDIGVGAGSPTTTLNGIDIMSQVSSSLQQSGVSLGLKAGYGPFDNTSLYLVGELSGIGHRIYDSNNYIQFNSYLVGPGLVFYPVPLIQIAGSVGYSFVSNITDLPINLYSSKSGFAYSVSTSLDFGNDFHGILISLGYSGATNRLNTSDGEQRNSIVSVSLRYAYRDKSNKLDS